jgi:hypothetical protein
MLGKVDELAVNTDTRAIPFNIGETIKVVDGPLTDSMVLLKKSMKKSAKLWLRFSEEKTIELVLCKLKSIIFLLHIISIAIAVIVVS